MSQANPIRVRPGDRSGEFVVTVPPGWELRMRRVLREVMPEPLPDPHEKGISENARQGRLRARQERMRKAICKYVSDLLAADIVGKEVALSTRSRYGQRLGSLREHVAAILRDAASGE